MTTRPHPTATGRLRIALLHLAPRPGALDENRQQLEAAIQAAAAAGAGWIISPELCTTGYTFADGLGTDWIDIQPDAWLQSLCRDSARHHLTLFLGLPERDPQTGLLHNAVLVVEQGVLVGRHRKINALRQGSEAWSSPGDSAIPVPVAAVGSVGILICGDAFSPGIARHLKQQGARLLVSAAAWAPGFHGPDGEWERCSLDTGLPLLVCNRTGPDRTLDFRAAESVVVKDGKRLLTFRSPDSAMVVFDWDLQRQEPIAASLRTSPLVPPGTVTHPACGPANH